MTNPTRAFTNDKGERVYLNDDPKMRFFSVTTILGSTLPKPQLVPWASKVVAETAVELLMDERDPHNSQQWLHAYYDEEEGDFDYELLAEDLKKAPEWVRDSAGEHGDNVHTYVEHILNVSLGDSQAASNALNELVGTGGLEYNSSAHRTLLLFVKWLEENDVVPVAMEFTIYNDTHGYAGSCDIAAYVNGRPTYIDVKTGRVYPEAALQLAAYAHGEYMLPDEEDEREPMPFKDVQSYGAILDMKPNRLKYIDVDVSEPIFDCFLALVYVRRVWNDEGRKEALGNVLFDVKEVKR
jgi:hypothetical protein